MLFHFFNRMASTLIYGLRKGVSITYFCFLPYALVYVLALITHVRMQMCMYSCTAVSVCVICDDEALLLPK